MEDITSLLRKAFDNAEIGLIGIINSNGADRYECPGCREGEDIEGCCSFNAPLMNIKHLPTCTLAKLHELVHQHIEEAISIAQLASDNAHLVDIIVIRPTKVIADSAPVQWGNSLWRIWYAFYEDRWYHTGDRTAAGTLTINQSSPVDETEVQQVMTRFKLSEIKLPH